MAEINEEWSDIGSAILRATIDRSGKIDPARKIYKNIDNYIYLYHTNTMIILPGFPADLQDSSSAKFSESPSLGRSAPIYSYTGSGPRQVNVQLEVHRESVNLMNYMQANTELFDPGDDYVDVMIKQLQAAALPAYAASEKMVDPPLVACRFGKDVFIKGVINGQVGISYGLPLLRTGKLAQTKISFTVSEVDAYDAIMVSQIGSYRDPGDIKLNPTLDSDVYWTGGASRPVNVVSSGVGSKYSNMIKGR